MPLYFKVTRSKSGRTLFGIKASGWRGEVSALEKGSGHASGGGLRPLILLFFFFVAFQVCDSKLERSIWASLPGAIPLPRSSTAYRGRAKTTGWPLISRTKKNEIVAFETPCHPLVKVIFLRRGVPRMERFRIAVV